MSLIALKNVSKTFKGKTILENANLSVEKGDIFGIIGKSGSGKSTLLWLMLGLHEPTKGTITRQKGLRIGLASQDTSFYPRLTVEENLHYFGRLFGVPKQVLPSRIDNLLRLVELDDARKTISKNLSGGMKRRLDICLALIHNPEILILDEPLTGLDIVLQKKIWQILRNINKQGKTLIISSHNIPHLEQSCNKIAFIYNRNVFSNKDMKIIIHDYGLKSLEDMFERYYV